MRVYIYIYIKHYCDYLTRYDKECNLVPTWEVDNANM